MEQKKNLRDMGCINMKCKEMINMYSYICSKGQNGITVKNLMERFKIKKKDVISFLDIMSNFGDNINFHYYSTNEDEFYDDFQDIDIDTIIEIDDTLYSIKSKLDLEDTSKLYEVLEDYDFYSKDKESDLVNIIGDGKAQNFKYINKGKTKETNSKHILSLKNKIIDYILSKKVINLRCNEQNDIKRYKDVISLGIYFDKMLKEYFLVASYESIFKEIALSSIENVEELGLDQSEKFETFDIDKYLMEKRTGTLVLNVYNEASVVKKIEKLFDGYEYCIDEKEKYFLYNIKVDNPMKFKNIINNFGRSVIVEEPVKLRNEIIEESISVINNYKKYMK